MVYLMRSLPALVQGRLGELQRLLAGVTERRRDAEALNRTALGMYIVAWLLVQGRLSELQRLLAGVTERRRDAEAR